MTRAFDRERGAEECAAYASASPYPHIVLDDVLGRDEAEAALAEFPDRDDPIWTSAGRHYDNPGNGSKFEMARLAAMGPELRAVIGRFQSPAFVAYLEALTAIDSLLPDPELFGGGLNLVEPGGYLRVHA